MQIRMTASDAQALLGATKRNKNTTTGSGAMGAMDLERGPLVRDLIELGTRDKRTNAIEQAKREWESVVDSLPQLICLVAQDGSVVRANRTVEWWGIAQVSKVRGTHLHDLLHPACDDPDCYLEDFLQDLRPRVASGTSLQCEAPDARLKRYLRVQLRPFAVPLANHAAGAPVAVAIVEDVTEIKRADEAQRRFQEELERRVEARTAELVLANNALHQLIAERERAEASLLQSQSELRLLNAQLQTAQEKERRRIASELHDSVNQTMSAIKISIEHGLQLVRSDRVEPGLALLDETVPAVQGAMEEVRRISMDLRPTTLDDLGILPTLGWFCREFKGVYTGIKMASRFHIEERDVPDVLKTIIFRIAQEGVNNVLKHARAANVSIGLAKEHDTITLVVEDDGVGFDADRVLGPDSKRCGIGLRSMRERAEFSGASFKIDSRPGGGTRIIVAWACTGLAESATKLSA